MIDNEVQDVLLFRYLPSLWYTHPIPNPLREFWYTERVDILNFMKKNYAHLDIEFLPDQILKDLAQHSHVTKPLVDNLSHLPDISSNLLCKISPDSNYMFDIFMDKFIT
jgi:hypothetical protein